LNISKDDSAIASAGRRVDGEQEQVVEEER
jgi:hypothetical protein